MGMNRPVHVLQRGCEVKDIVHMAAIAVIDAQGDGGEPRPEEPLEAEAELVATPA